MIAEQTSHLLDAQKLTATAESHLLEAQKLTVISESEVEELKYRIARMKAEVQEGGNDLAMKTMEIDRLREHIQNMSERAEESVNELDNTRTDLALREDDHQVVSEALMAKDEQLSSVDSRLHELKSLLGQAEERLAHSEAQEQQQQEQNEEQREKIASLEADLWDMSKQQEELVVLRGTNRRKDEDKLKLDIGTLPLPSPRLSYPFCFVCLPDSSPTASLFRMCIV